jgi:hypothetical protein
MIQPAVEAVHRPHVTVFAEIVPENVVIVQVVPPEQLLASKVTSSPATGCVVLFAPPLERDQIVSLLLSHVQVVAQAIRNFAVACAEVGAQHASARRKRPKSLFMAGFLTAPARI